MSEVRIWKYVLEPGTTVFDMPAATPLHVAAQDGNVCLWALVEPGTLTRKRAFQAVGTGHPFDSAPLGPYIGTAHMPGPLVFHVFEVDVPDWGVTP